MIKSKLLQKSLLFSFTVTLLTISFNCSVTTAKPRTLRSITDVSQRRQNRGQRRTYPVRIIDPCRKDPDGCRQTYSPARATRAACLRDNIGVVVPKIQENDLYKIPPDLTISDRPTFFFHIPATSVTQADFILRDDEHNVLLRKVIDFSGNNLATDTGLIIAYTLPESSPSLEVGKKYIWRFSVLCNKDDRSSNPKFSGWIKRVEPSTKVREQLRKAKTKLERFHILEKNSYWFDKIKILHELRVANPQNPDLDRTWLNILNSAAVEPIATQSPVIEVKSVPEEEVEE